MKYLRLLLFAAAALGAGLFFGTRINAFLSITLSDKALGEVSHKEHPVESAPLPFRMVDLGGVGIEADRADWGKDYSHNTRRFQKLFLSDAPFVNQTELERVFAKYRAYIDRMADLGFNAVEFQVFLELIDFDKLGDGYEVYSRDSVYRSRHEAVRKLYGKFFEYAREKGLRVILSTDMVALTPPLEEYMRTRLGNIDVESGEFWNIYEKGLEELFEIMPSVGGVMIRIGEAGPLYNRSDWDYRSELMVRSVASVKQMLRSFLEAAEKYDKYVIFRTWSVGVGEVGDMHTDPAVYDEILGDIYSENLLVSTKLTKGDFWNNVPNNPTLYTGRHKRIVELQARREFEAFNVIPNYLAPTYQSALASFMKENPNIEGVWVWTQAGGPIRQGPLMIYPFHGMWLWTDANVFSTAMIARDPGQPAETWTRKWVRETFGGDKEVEDGLTELLTLSHGTAVRGLTIPEFAREEVTGVGMEIPPVIYSYWDLVETSTSVMSLVYTTVKGDVDGAVADGFQAVEDVRRMKAILASVEGGIEKGREWIPGMKASLDYEENLFETLAYHKKFLLEYYEWLDLGGKDRKAEWENALDEYQAAKSVHMEKYGNNLSFPAYNFEMADTGAIQAKRTDVAVWAARALLVVLILFIARVLLIRSESKSGIKIPAFLSIFTFGMLEAFTSFGAPLFVLTTGVPVLLYFTGLRFLVFSGSRRSGYALSLIPVLALMGIVLSVVSVRGPYYFWYNIWTSGGFRLALAASAAFLLLSHFYLVYQLAGRTLRARALTGRMLFLTSSLVTLYSLVYVVFGIDNVMGWLNDEILMMPVMVSRVLGFSTHLDFLVDIILFVVKAGAVIAFTGLVLSSFRSSGGGRKNAEEHAEAEEADKAHARSRY